MKIEVDKIHITKNELEQYQYDLLSNGRFAGSNNYSYNTAEKAEQEALNHIKEFPDTYELNSNGVWIVKP